MWKTKVLVPLLLCAAIATGCGTRKPAETVTTQPTPTEREENYRVAEVERGTFEKKLKMGCQIYCYGIRNIKCDIPDAVMVGDTKFSYGQEVKKDQVLFRFVQRYSEAELARLELEYERAVDNKEKRTYQYYKQIRDIKGSDEGARLQRIRLQNELNSYLLTAEKACGDALERLEEYRQRPEEKTLNAPFDGIVYNAVDFIGGVAYEKGRNMLVLLDAETICVRVPKPSEEFLAMSAPGTPVAVKCNGKTYEAEITSTPNGISGTPDRCIYITGEKLNQLPYKSKPSVEYVSQRLENVLMVDMKAIQSDQYSDYVTVLHDGVLSKQYVVCGPNDGTRVCILEGLQAGDRVAIR